MSSPAHVFGGVHQPGGSRRSPRRGRGRSRCSTFARAPTGRSRRRARRRSTCPPRRCSITRPTSPREPRRACRRRLQPRRDRAVRRAAAARARRRRDGRRGRHARLDRDAGGARRSTSASTGSTVRQVQRPGPRLPVLRCSPPAGARSSSTRRRTPASTSRSREELGARIDDHRRHAPARRPPVGRPRPRRRDRRSAAAPRGDARARRRVRRPRRARCTTATSSSSATCAVRALALPGHTSDMTGLLVAGRALVGGDSLFADGIARPDLQQGDPEGARAMARTLHATLHDRILALGDDVVLLPCHTHPGVNAAAIAPRLAEVRDDRRPAGDRRSRPSSRRRCWPACRRGRRTTRRSSRSTPAFSRSTAISRAAATAARAADDGAADPDPAGPRRAHRARLRAIGDANRIRILDLLRDGELPVAQITEQLGRASRTPPSTWACCCRPASSRAARRGRARCTASPTPASTSSASRSAAACASSWPSCRRSWP